MDNTDLSYVGPHLAKLRNLRDLAIMESQASDATCRNLRALKRLRRLHMFSPREVTNAGVAHLSELKQLRSIYVGFSRITDEAFRTLGGLPNAGDVSTPRSTAWTYRLLRATLEAP